MIVISPLDKHFDDELYLLWTSTLMMIVISPLDKHIDDDSHISSGQAH